MLPLAPLACAVFFGLPNSSAIPDPTPWSLAGCSLAGPGQDSAEEKYRFIAGLFADGHWELCAKEAAAFLDEHSDHKNAALARYRLAGSQFELDRFSDAAPHFRELTRQADFEFAGEVQLRLGQCELQAGRLDEARSALQTARDSGKSYLIPHATFLLGQVDFRAKRYGPALLEYQQSLELDANADTAPHALRGVAWCQYRLEQFDASAKTSGEFLKQHPQHPMAGEVRFVQGEALRGLNRIEAALRAYDQVPLGTYFDAALRGKALARATNEDHPGAARDWQELLEKNPGGPYALEARIHAGAHFLRAGANEKAWQILSKPTDSKDAELLYWRGKAASLHLGGEQALEILDQALGQKPASDLAGRIQSLRGEVLFGLGRVDESARAFEAAESDYALHAAATAHLAAGRADEALRAAEKLLTDYPESEYSAASQWIRAESLFALERYAECGPLFQAFHTQKERDTTQRGLALNRQAWCQYLSAELGAAEKSFERMASKFEDHPQAEESQYMAGRCALENGRAEQAADHWRSYQKRFRDGPNRTLVLMGLGEVAADSEALKELLENYASDPIAPQAALQLAKNQEAKEDWPAAIDAYENSVERFAQSETLAEALYGLAWCRQQIGEPAQALPALDRLLSLESAQPWILPALELKLWCAADAKDLDAAKAAWNGLESDDLDPERRFDAATKLVQALKDGGQSQDALSFLAPFTGEGHSKSTRVAALLESTWLALDLQQIEKASATLSQAQNLGAEETDLAQPAFFLGEALYGAAQFEQALPWYTLAAKTQGQDSAEESSDRALYKLGFAYLQLEKPEQAASAFGRLTSEHKKSPLLGESLYLQGEALWRAGQTKAAVAPLREVTKSHGKHAVIPKALFRLGQCLRAEGQAQEALAPLNTLVKKYGEFEAWAEAELERGRCLVAVGKGREARSAFERVLQRDKGILSAQARIEIGKWHRAQDDTEAALAEFLKVSMLYKHPEEVAEAIYRAGQCLEKSEDNEAALKQYQTAATEHPKTAFGKKAQERLQELSR